MMVVSTITLSICLRKQPIASPDFHWFEVANELLIFFATVMTLMYTPFITDVQARSKLGNAFIILFGYVCILNSVFILTSLCQAAQLLMRKYSVDQEQLEAIRKGETELVNIKTLKQAEGRLAAREMAKIDEADADQEHGEVRNALEDSGVKPLVGLPQGRQGKPHQSWDSAPRPGSTDPEALNDRLDDALRALDDLGDWGPTPTPAKGAGARQESAESDLF